MSDGGLLELRVHGVNNTPPSSMLFAIQQEYGDSLVGVYRERPTPGVVKALSWGGLARLSLLPRLPIATWLQSVASAGWIFVIPFGLANVAYWSRRLTLPGETYKTVRTTARLTRLFSLGMTLLLISSVCGVSLDMAERRIEVLLSSGSLPKWLAILRHTDVGDRMAALSLAPALTILLLWILATRTRVRYDKGNELPRSGDDRTEKWKFGTASFWDNADLSAHNTGIHTAAGLALTLLWTGQFWSGEHPRFGSGVILLSSAILLICAVLTATTPMATEDNAISTGRRWLTRALVALAVGAFVVQFVALIAWHLPTPEPPRLALFSLVPGAIVFVLLALAISALGWRTQRRPAYAVAAVLITIGLGALLAERLQWVGPRDVISVDHALFIVLLLIVVGWAGWLRWHERARVAEAWHGAAPGVLMILALFAAVLLSTVFVIVAAALLGDGKIRISQSETMTAPPIYLSFATLLIPAIVVLLLVLAVAGVTVVGRCRTPVEPALDATTQPQGEEMALLAELFDKSQPSGKHDSLYTLRCHTRRVASLLQRAEPMGSCLALIAAAAIIGGLVLAVLLNDHAIDPEAPWFYWLQKLGVGAALLVGTFIVGHGVAQGRPLGIVWDLICFLPRAAHPFGPPCYAQRAVPELHTYCRAWLDSPPTGRDDAAPRRLILSAHSLGGVLAVAVVLLLSDQYRDRIALLTYGCQLRAYFSRIFPELLGPPVLGVTDSSPAQLLRCPAFPPDPAPISDDRQVPASVLQILSGIDKSRWINLWRPTDYLGFPAYSRSPENPVDRPADEVTAEKADEGVIVRADTDADVRTLSGPLDADTRLEFKPRWIVQVDTHSDYFRTRQYPIAIEDLARLFVDSTTPRGERAAQGIVSG
jgi:hypothetical protein